MAEEKLIQLTVQLPASELTGVTTLLEQLRNLLTKGSSAPDKEQEVNSGFDETRFQTLTEAAESPAADNLPTAKEFTPAEVIFSDMPDSQAAALVQFSPVDTDIRAETPPWDEITAEGLSAAAESELPSPAAAGFSVSSGNEILHTQHGNSSVERLITTSPAPLTAEAVSLAFRRDDRRYDNGFPLY